MTPLEAKDKEKVVEKLLDVFQMFQREHGAESSGYGFLRENLCRTMEELRLFEKPKNNTKIEYLYRDAANYKIWNSCVVAGRLSRTEIAEIIGCLEDGCYFIP